DARALVVGSCHYDKAVAEDTYESSKGQRMETTPGADDNITGVGALLIAARAFRARYESFSPRHDIELVYFTGEEYPTGTLGSRYYVGSAVGRGQRFFADVNLDMLGNRVGDDRIYQINPGFGAGSWRVAELALGIAGKVGGGWKPMVRYPGTEESYL